MNEAIFLRDRKTQSAVERELLVIAEASISLRRLETVSAQKDTLENLFPSIPWHAIGAMGNRLRHEYGRVDPQIIWETLSSSDLADLAAAITARYSE